MKNKKIPVLAGTVLLSAILCSCTNIFDKGSNDIKVFTGYFAVSGDEVDEKKMNGL